MATTEIMIKAIAGDIQTNTGTKNIERKKMLTRRKISRK